MNILLILIIVFIIGLLFCSSYSNKQVLEAFQNPNKRRCPNILIQKGNEIYLYNTNVEKVPGVNPVKFNNLEDYVEYIEWQRSQGVRCPILFLHYSYDAQGKPIYKIRPSPLDLQGGLPSSILPAQLGSQFSKLFDASRDDYPYNTNSYPAFDPMNSNQGLITPLDAIKSGPPSTLSPNPMDPNWGGDKYTQALIDAGYYKGDEVSIYVP